MDLQLTDKLALVTGSTAGIGYAIAEALAREGFRLFSTVVLKPASMRLSPRSRQQPAKIHYPSLAI